MNKKTCSSRRSAISWCRSSGRRFLLRGGELAQGAAIFLGENLEEAHTIIRPLLQDFPGAPATGQLRVAVDQVLEYHLVRLAAVPQMPRELALLLGLGEH